MGILDINLDLGVGLMKADDHQLRREGTGDCTRSGRANCGDHADCRDTATGHECVCRAGYVHGDGTSCIADGVNAASEIEQARRTGDYLTTTQEQQSVQCTSGSCDGMVTWRVMVTLDAGASNIYALFGHDDGALELPPAFQVDPPFGSSVGGINPALFSNAEAVHDSWITIGDTDGTFGGLLSSIGIDWD